MYAIYLGPHDEPVREELLWWASERTFNRAVDTAITNGLVHRDYAAVKAQAELRRGFSGFGEYPGLLKALDGVAAAATRIDGESDAHYHHFASQMLDYRTVYRAHRERTGSGRGKPPRQQAG